MKNSLIKRYNLLANLKYNFRTLGYKISLYTQYLIDRGNELKKAHYEAFLIHSQHRQRYSDEYPYYYHLKKVVDNVTKFASICGLTREETRICILIALGHDFIEDVCLTYNDIVKVYGKEVADGIFACTELRGHNRSERHGETFWKELKKPRSRYGLYVKLCDIIANMEQGIKEGSKGSMLLKYVDEFAKTKEQLKDVIGNFVHLLNYIESDIVNKVKLKNEI